MTDQEFNLKFVKEVEKHEILYNYKLPGYSIKDELDKAWQEVAAQVNLPPAECKEKWRNLRTVFIRKMKFSQNGRGAGKRAYYLSDAMQFCVPYIKTSAPSSGNSPQVPSRSAGHDVTQETDSCDNRPSLIEFSRTTHSPLASSNYSTLPSPFNPTFTSEPNPANQCVVEYSQEYLRDKKANHLSNEAGDSSQKIDRQEGLKMFLLSLMPELEDLSNSQIKFFKRRVLNLIDEISTPQYNHQNQVGTPCLRGKSS